MGNVALSLEHLTNWIGDRFRAVNKVLNSADGFAASELNEAYTASKGAITKATSSAETASGQIADLESVLGKSTKQTMSRLLKAGSNAAVSYLREASRGGTEAEIENLETCVKDVIDTAMNSPGQVLQLLSQLYENNHLGMSFDYWLNKMGERYSLFKQKLQTLGLRGTVFQYALPAAFALLLLLPLVGANSGCTRTTSPPLATIVEERTYCKVNGTDVPLLEGKIEDSLDTLPIVLAKQGEQENTFLYDVDLKMEARDAVRGEVSYLVYDGNNEILIQPTKKLSLNQLLGLLSGGFWDKIPDTIRENKVYIINLNLWNIENKVSNYRWVFKGVIPKVDITAENVLGGSSKTLIAVKNPDGSFTLLKDNKLGTGYHTLVCWQEDTVGYENRVNVDRAIVEDKVFVFNLRDEELELINGDGKITWNTLDALKLYAPTGMIDNAFSTKKLYIDYSKISDTHKTDIKERLSKVTPFFVEEYRQDTQLNPPDELKIELKYDPSQTSGKIPTDDGYIIHYSHTVAVAGEIIWSAVNGNLPLNEVFGSKDKFPKTAATFYDFSNIEADAIKIITTVGPKDKGISLDSYSPPPSL